MITCFLPSKKIWLLYVIVKSHLGTEGPSFGAWHHPYMVIESPCPIGHGIKFYQPLLCLTVLWGPILVIHYVQIDYWTNKPQEFKGFFFLFRVVCFHQFMYGNGHILVGPHVCLHQFTQTWCINQKWKKVQQWDHSQKKEIKKKKSSPETKIIISSPETLVNTSRMQMDQARNKTILNPNMIAWFQIQLETDRVVSVMKNRPTPPDSCQYLKRPIV